jgi:3-dehydroquinate synthase
VVQAGLLSNGGRRQGLAPGDTSGVCGALTTASQRLVVSGSPAGTAFFCEHRYYPTGSKVSKINVSCPPPRAAPDPAFFDTSRLMPVPDKPQIVRVALGPRGYDVAIEPGSLRRIAERLAEWRKGDKPGAALVITDTNLASAHAATISNALRDAGWKTDTATIPAGETSKSLPVLASLYDALVVLPADRRTIVVGVGGGVVGDVAGFAAATYNRGLPFVQVPTSLLAMVDSSVGGKVGINHPQGKNLIGAFHQPIGVLIDPQALSTLPEREYRGGLAEVVKYGVILDAAFFAFLESNTAAINSRDPAALSHVISRSCRLKADVVEQDEHETTGLRAVLNYGHTFAHAFEALAGYGALNHGEAVAIGMIYASRLAERHGLTSPDITTRQQNLLAALGLPIELPPGTSFSATDVLGRMRLDKKNAAGRLRFILPTRLGEVRLFDDVPDEDVTAVLQGH